jgi:hypothetical protein
VAEALGRADAAGQACAQAQAKLRQVATDIRKKYETSADWMHARAELDTAAASVNTLRAAASAPLKNDPNYMQLQTNIDHLAGVLDSEASESSLSAEDRLALAQAKLDYATKLHQMDADALTENADYTAALQRLDQASAAWTALQSQLQTALTSDPALKSAQDEVAKAQTDLSAAEANLQGLLTQHAMANRSDYMQNTYGSNPNSGANYGVDYTGYPYYGPYAAYPYFGGVAVTTTTQPSQSPASKSKPVPSWSPFSAPLYQPWSPFPPQPPATATQVPSWSPFTQPLVQPWSPFPSQPEPTKTGH